MAQHAWRFFRSGGFDQVRLDRGSDLLALRELDQKLWVALSCPTQGIDFDAATLKLLDADGDGHIRAAELLDAVDFVAARLADPELLVAPPAALPLSDLRKDTPEGQAARAAAGRVLEALGKTGADADTIALADLADRARIFGQTRFNGDGVITAASATDAGLQALIAEIGAVQGEVADRSGAAGIDAPRITAFFAAAREALAWQQARPADTRLAELPDALAALAAVRDKIDDYFTRCRLVAFDAAAEAAINGSEAEFMALGRDNLAQPDARVAALPLARAQAGRPLPLTAGVNPAWAAALGEFACRVVTPLLGARDALAEADWQEVKSRLAAASAWAAARSGPSVSRISSQRVSRAACASWSTRASRDQRAWWRSSRA